MKTIESRMLLTTGVRLKLKARRKRKRSRRDDETDDIDKVENIKPDREDEDKEEEEPAKEEKADKPGTIEGYAAVFYDEKSPDTEYELWNDPSVRAVERVARGAFARATSEEDDCRALFNHESSAVLGRTASGTLQLSEDEQGLHYSVDLPDTQLGRDVAELVGRGDVTGSSFGFVVEQESWREMEEDNGRRVAIRTIESVRLLDVGPVTYPAYAGTSVGSRSTRHRRMTTMGNIEEARASYERWKRESVPLEAKLAAARARAIEVCA